MTETLWWRQNFVKLEFHFMTVYPTVLHIVLSSLSPWQKYQKNTKTSWSCGHNFCGGFCDNFLSNIWDALVLETSFSQGALRLEYLLFLLIYRSWNGALEFFLAPLWKVRRCDTAAFCHQFSKENSLLRIS